MLQFSLDLLVNLVVFKVKRNKCWYQQYINTRVEDAGIKPVQSVTVSPTLALTQRTRLSEKNVLEDCCIKKHSHVQETDHHWSRKEKHSAALFQLIRRAASPDWLALNSQECMLGPIRELVKYANTSLIESRDWGTWIQFRVINR